MSGLPTFRSALARYGVPFSSGATRFSGVCVLFAAFPGRLRQKETGWRPRQHLSITVCIATFRLCTASPLATACWAVDGSAVLVSRTVVAIFASHSAARCAG